jgi:beta-galactosidase
MVDREGRLVELGADGVALLVDPVELSLWRAAIDNDGLKLLGGGIPRLDGRRLPRWLALGIDRLEVGRVRVERPRRGRWIVERELRGAHPSCVVTHFQRIDIDSTGITFTETVRLPTELDDLPRVGTTFSVGGAFDRVRWFGRGPHECYPDRQSSAMAAVWDGGIDRLPYLVPQEFGLRTECRWFALEAPQLGLGLRVEGVDRLLHCSATHHRDADLYAAADQTELTARPEVIVHADAGHRGVGTASCGPDTLREHRLSAGTWSWRWRLSPYRLSPFRLSRS